MRDNGVPSFPDPSMTDHNGQQVSYFATPSSLRASPAFAAANKGCQMILTPVLETPSSTTAAQSARERHLFAFAKCLRDHGLASFPDPTTQGQLTQEMISSAGIDLHAPVARAAAKACLPSSDGAVTAQQLDLALTS